MRIAVTGHMGLPRRTVELVEDALRKELAPLGARGGLAGVTCLAEGADQIFAGLILALEGELEVVVPARKYREGLPSSSWAQYDDLFGQATSVHYVGHEESTPQAHMDASIYMVKRADRLMAVWDGQPSRSYGGTADVVAYAKESGVPLTVVWPSGASRD